jgi:hypothetical protein
MQKPDEFAIGWHTKSLDEIDEAILRFATICDVPILDPGVIDRVLRNDASVSVKPNPNAFMQLRGLLVMHYRERKAASESLGEPAASLIAEQIVERLSKRADGHLGGRGP